MAFGFFVFHFANNTLKRQEFIGLLGKVCFKERSEGREVENQIRMGIQGIECSLEDSTERRGEGGGHRRQGHAAWVKQRSE